MNSIFPKPRVILDTNRSKEPTIPVLEFYFAGHTEIPFDIGKDIGSVLPVSPEKKGVRLFVSLGEMAKSDTLTFFKAAAAFSRWVIDHPITECVLDVDQPPLEGNKQIIRAVLEGLMIGGFTFPHYKTKQEKQVNSLSIHIKTNTFQDLEREIERAGIIGESMDLARDWIREPANTINPQTLEDRAREAASHFGLTCKVIQFDELEKMGAGGITSVGRGSTVKPRLIVLEYHNNGEQKPIGLIGKAITFDTGGYSLKGTDSIKGMKYDKAGGITVLATIIAAARLKLKTNIVAAIPAAENMISGDAYRPDDILRLLSGLTVEISSTDAEGRLILADALTYTQNEYKPSAMLDIATLTGGVLVALGNTRAGLLSNSDSLANLVFQTGEQIGEKVWRLPLDDDYFDLIKSDDADMRNSGSRYASTIVGGIFLKQVVSDTIHWAHLDIAGTGEMDKETAWSGKGPSGFGIRLLLETIKQLSES